MKDKEKYSKLKSFHFVCEKNYLLFSQILPNLNEEKVFSFGLPIKNSKLSEVSINLKKVSKFTSEIKVCLAAELSKKIEIEVRLYHEAKMCEVIKFQGFHQSLISIFIGQKKFGFTKDEKYQWNSFLNKFLIICKESGRSLENFIPSRV
ncbi:MAG: DUF1249 domain-containing protein [Pseudomonadota bacterium]|jgi:uncharacterized protein YqiB (DUF1249 family)|nr:DUF1249 domain-containing protein [Pseudomonadota bacterium]|tara:strand:- start:2003 stop:2449 length:447 start_codon:yes stop_codon:yes gene_type:complete